MKELLVVTQGTYVASAVRMDQYPEKKLPEIVFIGRSNVGKSSLINSLTRVKNLARVSSQPGKTQTINFYEIGMRIRDEARNEFYLVDLPGYGYAKTGKEQRKIWAKFIEEYMLASRQLKFVCQLVDIRHEPMPADVEQLHWLVRNNLPVLIIATKADKLGTQAREKQVSLIRKKLGIKELPILPYSSLKNIGRDDLLEVIAGSLTEHQMQG